MQDMIDKRNFKEKCARSIVKGYNVHYMTQEEAAALQAAKDVQKVSQEPDTGKKMAFEADERYADQPSSTYGTKEVEDPVTKEQIEQILGERKDNPFEALQGKV